MVTRVRCRWWVVEKETDVGAEGDGGKETWGGMVLGVVRRW